MMHLSLSLSLCIYIYICVYILYNIIVYNITGRPRTEPEPGEPNRLEPELVELVDEPVEPGEPNRSEPWAEFTHHRPELLANRNRS